MLKRVPKHPFLRLAIASSVAIISGAAQQRTLTSADYARAEKFMPYNTTPLVFHSGVRPTWLADDRFWYRNTTAEGAEFVLVDAARATRVPAFDHARLPAALSTAAGTNFRRMVSRARSTLGTTAGHAIARAASAPPRLILKR